MGVPVFSSKGAAGITYVLKPSFGYIIGFLVASVAVGTIAKSKENDKLKPYQRMIIANTVGVLIIYTIGMIYMYLILKLYLATEVTVKTIFLSGFLIFLPKEIVFIFLTALLASKLKPYVKMIQE
jgi:biotin transport system substrate-specific component